MPHHHPDDETLFEYAAGLTSPAVSLLVATHLALCPVCRARVRAFESAGAPAIDGAMPAALTRPVPPAIRPEPAPAAPAAGDVRLPQPLRGLVGSSLDTLPWRRGFFGPRTLDLDIDGAGVSAQLLAIPPGAAMPRHTHTGLELTLVLAGGFTDGGAHFVRGDVQVGDAGIDHRPRADLGEDCICLAVVEGDLVLTGALGSLVARTARLFGA